MCLIMSFVLLLTGCYSHTTITKDTPPLPPTVEVTFRLNDGRDIVSRTYERVANGYHAIGTIRNKEFRTEWDFDGIVQDEQIKEVVIIELDTSRTVVAVLLCVGSVVALFTLSQPVDIR